MSAGFNSGQYQKMVRKNAYLIVKLRTHTVSGMSDLQRTAQSSDLPSTDLLQRERAPVYEFDYYRSPDIAANAQDAYFKLKASAPPLFWTEQNGGHWVVNSADLAIEVLKQPQLYSNRYISIPANPNMPQIIPQMLDPPEHRYYRQVLKPFFDAKKVDPVVPRINAFANQAIDAVIDSGQCEFVNGVAAPFALSVFMELFGFPLDKFDYIRELEFSFFSKAVNREEQREVSLKIMQLIGEIIAARRAEPRDDWISKWIHQEYEGGKLSDRELMSMSFMMFLAGLDTVANALSFGMRHLAHDAELRQRMMDDPECIPAAVEELLRRYTFVNLPRYVTHETKLGGITLSEGDSVLVPLVMISWDERVAPDPEKVTLERPPCKHAAFGSGVHMCPGLHFARKELAVFYRMWLEKIGHFEEIEDGDRAAMRGGPVIAIKQLKLSWSR
jgi:cytochrome P450